MEFGLIIVQLLRHHSISPQRFVHPLISLSDSLISKYSFIAMSSLISTCLHSYLLYQITYFLKQSTSWLITHTVTPTSYFSMLSLKSLFITYSHTLILSMKELNYFHIIIWLHCLIFTLSQSWSNILQTSALGRSYALFAESDYASLLPKKSLWLWLVFSFRR